MARVPSPEVLVMGAAVVDRGRVLAARRTTPEHARGMWEFPGGKVEPGEDPDVAIVREIREELGCEVAVVDHLDGEEPVKDGYTLRVAVVRLLGGEPVPHEHDAIRWLGPDELDVVTWLEPDLPFLPELRERLLASARDTEGAP
jgi:8-oxo-dGTP diphosphatase